MALLVEVPGVIALDDALLVVSVLPLVAAAPIDVPLPVEPVAGEVPVDDDALLVSVGLVVAVLGRVGALDRPVPVLEVVEDVDVSVVVDLRSPQAASDRAATSATAAQRARGVAFIRTLL